MANLPTYAEIGIKASIIVSILRIMQGMSSMREIMRARIYITAIIKPPIQYQSVCFVSISVAVGSIAALGIATLTTRTGFNWRVAFMFGVVIALVDIVARTKLRETPEFANAKTKMKRVLEKTAEQGLEKHAELLLGYKLLKGNNAAFDKIKIKSFFHFLGIYCGWPLSFYLIYIYFTPILKNTCGYSSADVILHNFYLSIFQLLTNIVILFLSKKIYPLFISKFIGFLFLGTLLIVPYVMSQYSSIYSIFFIQALFVSGLRETIIILAW